MTGSETNA